jgi:hypothetical protein
MNMNGVVGTDGVYPIVDDEPLWRQWSIEQIYLGQEGEGKYVPKVKDWVIDPDVFEFWVVDHVDPVSLIPTLRPFVPGRVSGIFTEDALIGVGPGQPSDVYRVYLNDAVWPHTLSVDTGIHIGGTMSSYCKIFLGTDTSEATGKVISKVYDNSGNFVSDAVQLELAAIDSHTNYSVKYVPRCHCTEKHPNNEIVTVVIYSDNGHVVYKRQLLMENTDTISDVHGSTKYISEISLECIWLSSTIPDQIEFPTNDLMNGLNMTGVVHYSDGSKARYPVNGGKFTMLGIDSYLSSIPGHTVPLTLRYSLGANEIAYASTGVNNGAITKPFSLVTTNPNKSIAVKLFGYPEWQSDALGYKMRWFMMNMERNVKFEVTGLVRFSENTGPFDPKLYGVLQRKNVTINLHEVSAAFIPFVHTQLVDIVLHSPPTNDMITPWSVNTVASDTLPRFGVNLFGEIKSTLVNFKSGIQSKDQWLQEFYLKTRPLVDKDMEAGPMPPSHFIVQYGTSEIEYTIDQWDEDLSIGAGLGSGKNAYIRFINRQPSGDLQLSWAAVTLKLFL